jgi:hypothetical protein
LFDTSAAISGAQTIKWFVSLRLPETPLMMNHGKGKQPAQHRPAWPD